MFVLLLGNRIRARAPSVLVSASGLSGWVRGTSGLGLRFLTPKWCPDWERGVCGVWRVSAKNLGLFSAARHGESKVSREEKGRSTRTRPRVGGVRREGGNRRAAPNLPYLGLGRGKKPFGELRFALETVSQLGMRSPFFPLVVSVFCGFQTSEARVKLNFGDFARDVIFSAPGRDRFLAPIRRNVAFSCLLSGPRSCRRTTLATLPPHHLTFWALCTICRA